MSLETPIFNNKVNNLRTNQEMGSLMNINLREYLHNEETVKSIDSYHFNSEKDINTDKTDISVGFSNTFGIQFRIG